jgi:citrate lyase subunit beta/citryl-CoA lyase
MCPGNRPDFLAKLAVGAQDVSVIDLEDGVHADRKEEARNQIRQSIPALDWQSEVVVRINDFTTEHAPHDIRAAVDAGAEAIMLTKTSGADEVIRAAALLTEAESANGRTHGTTQIWAMIESAIGLLRIEEICFAHERMTGVLFGGGDLAVDLQIKRFGLGPFRRTGVPFNEYTYGRGKLVLAARAAGITPIDTGNTATGDEDRTRLYAEYSAQMGFAGAAIFSPRQIPWVNETYSPAPEDIEWARQVTAAYAAAGTEEKKTVIVIDGEMVDGPFVIHAHQILERARAAGQVN